MVNEKQSYTLEGKRFGLSVSKHSSAATMMLDGAPVCLLYEEDIDDLRRMAARALEIMQGKGT